MPTYQVAYNGTTRVATVQANGDALPGGSVNVGSFVHDPVVGNDLKEDEPKKKASKAPAKKAANKTKK